MKLSEIQSQDQTLISGYGEGAFRIGDQKVSGSLIITASGYYPWAATSPEDMTVDSLSLILEQKETIELLIMGMGARLTFPKPEIRQLLEQNNIALEIMDTGAASRTYNLLLQEGRRVVAALISI